MPEKNNSGSNSEQNAAADLLYRLADKSFEMEANRSESLSRQTTMLITCISIMSIAVATVLTLITSANRNPLVILLFALNTFVLLGGLSSCVVAMFRKPYKVLVSPKELRVDIDSKLHPECTICNELLASRHYADSLEESYRSLFSKNEFVRKANKAALILIMLSCIISSITIIYGCICV